MEKLNEYMKKRIKLLLSIIEHFQETGTRPKEEKKKLELLYLNERKRVAENAVDTILKQEDELITCFFPKIEKAELKKIDEDEDEDDDNRTLFNFEYKNIYKSKFESLYKDELITYTEALIKEIKNHDF